MKTALVLFVLMFTLIVGVEGQRAEFDLLIRNGRILDGTGNPSFVNDVGLRDGKIAAIGVLANARAARVIDANGLAVAPGFIDIHNHSDDTVLEDGDAQSMIRQGVTSMILGEGGSAAPSEAWKDFSSYFAELKRRGVSTNIGSYIGSSTVWTTVHGAKAGPASADELNRMRAVVREAMEQGALGVASSLSGPPGVWIDTDTLVAMCEVAAPYGGIYSTHIRTEGEGVFKAVSEAMEIGRRARVPVDVIHLKIAEHKLWGKMPDLVSLITAARAQGQLVEANVYPYRAGQNNLASIIPPWAHEGGSKALIQRLKDPALRSRLESEILNGIPGSDWTAVKNEGPLAAGHPHPRYYGTFPRVLGRYVREEKLISLEEAVRKMTSANAAKIRIYDRGLLRPGQWADVTIFNPNTIIDNATFEKPHQYATGVEYVIVNGKIVLEHGRHTGARPGAILYGQGRKQ